MPRQLRFEFAGACYHVINRGNYQRPIFAQPGASLAFYQCLDEACSRFHWLVHAAAIMRNHFHLALETPEPNLSDGMKWLQGTWAQRFNRFHGLRGRPFQGRYRAAHVEVGHALAQVAHYIHLNPVRARILPVERVGDYRWSSLAWFTRRARPGWLDPVTVLAESGGLADSAAGWRSYQRYLAVLYEEDPRFRDDRCAELMRSWAIGSAAFRAELRARTDCSRDHREPFLLLGADREAVWQARVEVWEEQLRRLARALDIALDRLPSNKSATEKLQLAAALKMTSSVSTKWLAQRLQMGAAGSMGPLLTRFRASGGTERPAFKAALSGFLS